jgi:hypothetical protein
MTRRFMAGIGIKGLRLAVGNDLAVGKHDHAIGGGNGFGRWATTTRVSSAT